MFSNDAEWGGFGFLNKDKFFDTFFIFGMSAGFWGSAGYIISLLFFSPVIVSASFLTEPFLGQLFGYWMNIDAFPGLMTWLGTLLVCLGILSIQRAEQQRKTCDQIQIAEDEDEEREEENAEWEEEYKKV